MAQDGGFDHASGPTVTTFLNGNISNGNFDSARSSSIDLGNPSPIRLGLEIKLAAQASADGLAYLHIYWGMDGTDFSGDNGDAGDNSDKIPIRCKASVTVVHVTSIPVKGRHVEFQLENQSGGTINQTGSALVLTDIFIDQA